MKKRAFTPQQKAKLVIEVLREEKTINEIASSADIHPNLLRKWRAEAMEGLASIFENDTASSRKQQRKLEEKEDMYLKQIGKLTTQLEWLKKKSGITVWSE